MFSIPSLVIHEEHSQIIVTEPEYFKVQQALYWLPHQLN